MTPEIKKALDLALEALELFSTPNWAGTGVDKVNAAITAIRKARSATVQEMTAADPADWVPCTPEWINQGGDCAKSPRVWNAKECNHYHPATPPAAPVQPVAWSDAKQSELNDWFLSLPTGRQAVLLEDKWMLAGAAFLAGKTTQPAQPAVQDAEGENKAVRSFLMLYGQPGLTVGQMKKHMTMSGFKAWPAWVETEPDGAHLTKAGAQLWIRHLFALEATPHAPQPVPVKTYHDGKPWPVAPKPWVGLTDEEYGAMHNTHLRNGGPIQHFTRAIETKLKEKNA
jgi:hypothetical protein